MPEESIRVALLADDDPLIRLAAADILEAAGFAVEQAADAEEALAILEQEAGRIVLLFTDVQMPPSQLTGFDLARACARRWPDVSIVVSSGLLQPQPGDLPDSALFIGKPFSAQVVYECLHDVLPAQATPSALRDLI